MSLSPYFFSVQFLLFIWLLILLKCEGKYKNKKGRTQQIFVKMIGRFLQQ